MLWKRIGCQKKKNHPFSIDIEIAHTFKEQRIEIKKKKPKLVVSVVQQQLAAAAAAAAASQRPPTLSPLASVLSRNSQSTVSGFQKKKKTSKHSDPQKETFTNISIVARFLLFNHLLSL